MNLNSLESKRNKENKEKLDPRIEIGSLQDVEASLKFEIVSKTIDNDWGGEKSEEIANIIKNSQIKLSEESIDFYKKIKKLAKDNRETLRWLSFAINKNETIKLYTINNLISHKNYLPEQAKELLKRFEVFYKSFENQDLLRDEIVSFVKNDIKEREEKIEVTKEKINKAIYFFNPQASEIENVIFLPTNPFEQKYSGSAINMSENFYVNDKIDGTHEFLHGIINPITEKIKLNDKEQSFLIEKCPEKLKFYKYAKSILNEEIIRTYDFYSINKKISFEDFKKGFLTLTKDRLLENLNLERKIFSNSIASSVEELLDPNDDTLNKYYERYIKDEIQEIMWKFFENYQNSKENNFEKYFVNNYKNIFS